MAAYTTIDDPSAYFKVQLYTGIGSSLAVTFNDTDTDMQPDLVWVKSRTDNQNHNISDAVRGGTKTLYVNSSYFEETKTEAIASFQSDGFTVGNWEQVNDSGDTFVAWCWKANGQGSSNTDGTINTTYTSANTTSGFSIIKYTGTGSNATIGHGLGAAPKMVIIKKTNTSADWVLGQEGLGGWNYVMNLNSTSARADQSAQFQSTAPSSSVITLGTEGQVNGSGDTFICYAFAEKTGFSKFGTYEGNSSADGPFIFTGFRPAFILLKKYYGTTGGSGGGDNWILVDNKRNTYNIVDKRLYPNADTSEATADFFDFCSNGFKCKTTNGEINENDNFYIYAAFSESPFCTSSGVPNNAR